MYETINCLIQNMVKYYLRVYIDLEKDLVIDIVK